MYLLGIGLVLLALKYLEIGPVAAWSWWVIFAPFAAAVTWWAWADSTGYTKRKAMELEDGYTFTLTKLSDLEHLDREQRTRQSTEKISKKTHRENMRYYAAGTLDFLSPPLG